MWKFVLPLLMLVVFSGVSNLIKSSIHNKKMKNGRIVRLSATVVGHEENNEAYTLKCEYEMHGHKCQCDIPSSKYINTVYYVGEEIMLDYDTNTSKVFLASEHNVFSIVLKMVGALVLCLIAILLLAQY